MARYTFSKATARLEALQAHLKANGFPNARMSYDSGGPTIAVEVDSGDPTTLVNAWVDPDCIALASDKPVGSDGVPECASDGSAVHVVTIKKVDTSGTDVTSGSEQVKVIPNQLVTVTPSATPSMTSGTVAVNIGPTTLVGEVIVKVVGLGNDLKEQKIKLRFV